MTTGTAKFDIVLLAAGQSKRFGPENKLLADAGGEPLLRRVAGRVRGLTGSGARLILVTGHEAYAITACAGELADVIVHNPQFETGLAGSVATGASAVYPGRGAMIVQGDMPALSRELLDALAVQFEQHDCRAIVFPRAPDGRQGTPVIWPADLLGELATLEGDTGAKPLIARHADRLAPVDIKDDEPLADIDTVAALDAWRNR